MKTAGTRLSLRVRTSTETSKERIDFRFRENDILHLNYYGVDRLMEILSSEVTLFSNTNFILFASGNLKYFHTELSYTI